MSSRYPYATAPSYLSQLIATLRSSFPPHLAIDTLKKLGIAPRNESSTISVLKTLGLLDSAGQRTPRAAEIFSQRDDERFAEGLSDVVRETYSDLFEIRGDNAWNLSQDELITYFRHADGTSAQVGRLQAKTFRILAQAAGQPARGAQRGVPQPAPIAPRSEAAQEASGFTFAGQQPAASGGRSIHLTLHIDLHLPASSDQATYDRIFKSLREQILDLHQAEQ